MIHARQLSIAVAGLLAHGVLADFSSLGPYPAPIHLNAENSLVAAQWQNLSSTIDAYLSGNTSSQPALAGVENITFSMGMFSLNDPAAIQLQYHHTSADVQNATNGTNKVDADSIYRVASVSKLITTFAGMIELSVEQWNTPLTQIQPDFAEVLRNYTSASASDPILQAQWDQITPWSLATQLSGLPTVRTILYYT
jgi:hypothetical protein